ncbi:MAG TPA: ferritin-like domain-containing protein [Chthoniobacterales bacterium]
MRFTSLKLDSVRDLLLEELKDLYSAETQLVEALPKMAQAASSPELQSAFKQHLNETQGQVSRLEQVFQQLGQDPGGETCDAMKGLVKEAQHFLTAQGAKEVIDAGLIGAAQRVEHYEMAGYGTARTLAQQVGENQIANLLQQTLEEESQANEKLTAIAEKSVNPSASSR